MSTSLLRAENLDVVPDPLRSQLRTLEAIAGGRYALIPAALIYRRPGPAPAAGQPAGPDPSAPRTTDHPPGLAELSLVLVDVRLGRISWRTVARGAGDVYGFEHQPQWRRLVGTGDHRCKFVSECSAGYAGQDHLQHRIRHPDHQPDRCPAGNRRSRRCHRAGIRATIHLRHVGRGDRPPEGWTQSAHGGRSTLIVRSVSVG